MSLSEKYMLNWERGKKNNHLFKNTLSPPVQYNILICAYIYIYIYYIVLNVQVCTLKNRVLDSVVHSVVVHVVDMPRRLVIESGRHWTGEMHLYYYLVLVD